MESFASLNSVLIKSHVTYIPLLKVLALIIIKLRLFSLRKSFISSKTMFYVKLVSWSEEKIYLFISPSIIPIFNRS